MYYMYNRLFNKCAGWPNIKVKEREREIHSAAFINKVCLGSEVAPSFSSQAMP